MSAPRPVFRRASGHAPQKPRRPSRASSTASSSSAACIPRSLRKKYGEAAPRTTSVRDAYDWDPATLLEGVGEHDVLGVEAALWSETFADRAGLDLLAFPRLLGLAEVGWSPSAGRSWRDYRHRLAAHGPRLSARGVGFTPRRRCPGPRPGR